VRAVELLMAEHRVIRKGLEVLEAMAAKVAQDAPPSQEDVAALLDFFQVFADRCHHAKEEWGLFPHMGEAGVPCMGGPLGVMLCDHVRARALRRQMKEALPLLGGDTDARRRFVEAANQYVDLMDQHIAREDQVLFPMAQEVTTAQEDAKLVEAFEELEQQVVGEGVHERYHHLVEELASKYL